MFHPSPYFKKRGASVMDPNAQYSPNNPPPVSGGYPPAQPRPQASAQSSAQAERQLKSAYQLTYFFGVIGIVYGAIILNLASISQTAGLFSGLLIGQGIVFLILGYFISQRSKVAIFVSLGLAALEIIENFALGNFDWAVFVAPLLYGYFMWRGLGAIDKLNA
jgi:hypothetical protein